MRVALIFGAPVIDPAGKHASIASTRRRPAASCACDRADQLVHLRVALDREQAR